MITKAQLNDAVNTAKSESTKVLQLVYDSLNQGQQKKLLNNEDVKAVFDRYGVVTEGA